MVKIENTKFRSCPSLMLLITLSTQFLCRLKFFQRENFTYFSLITLATFQQFKYFPEEEFTKENVVFM